MRWSWRNFRHATNVSWFALRAKQIGWFPKTVGASAALVGVAPIEWIPGINPIVALSAEIVFIPLLLWLAWKLVPERTRRALNRLSVGKPIPKGFLALVVTLFVAAFTVDSYMDFTYPGQDPVSVMLEPYIHEIERQFPGLS